MTRSRAWQRPAWYAYPAGRLRFLAELRACGVAAAQTRISRTDRKHRGGFQIEFTLAVPGLPPRHVRIVFAGLGSVPSVYADGPAESPHRYADGALCMWYPWDPEERTLGPPGRGGGAPRAHHGPPAPRRMVAEDRRVGRRRGAA